MEPTMKEHHIIQGIHLEVEFKVEETFILDVSGHCCFMKATCSNPSLRKVK